MITVQKNTDYSIPILFKQQRTVAPATTQAIAHQPTQKTESIKAKPTQKTIIKKELSPKKIKTNEIKTNEKEAPKKYEHNKKIEQKQPNQKKEELSDIAKMEKNEKLKAPIQTPDPTKKTLQETITTPTNISNALVSNNYREVETLRRNSLLQKELIQHWKPPVGAPADCICEISFFVNNNGTIKEIKMVKSSGITMYDISARQALLSMKMPQWTHSKPLTIIFKQ